VSRGRRAAYTHQAEGDRARARRPAHRRPSRRRRLEKRSATTRRCSTRSSRIRPSRALYLFPTKALAPGSARGAAGDVRDVRDAGTDLGSRDRTEVCPWIRVFTYDGDHAAGPRGGRSDRAPHIVLTTRTWCHSGDPAAHPRWAKLFREPPLRWVWTSLHAYRGRLRPAPSCKRVTAVPAELPHYGRTGVSSARPARFRTRVSWRERLTDNRSSSWTKSGAPRGEKFFIS